MGLGYWVLGAIALCARDRKCCGDDDHHEDNCCGRDSAASVLSDNGCGCCQQTVDDQGVLGDCGCEQEHHHRCDCERGTRRADCGYFNRNGNFEPGTNVHCFNNPRNCNPRSTCCCD